MGVSANGLLGIPRCYCDYMLSGKGLHRPVRLYTWSGVYVCLSLRTVRTVRTRITNDQSLHSAYTRSHSCIKREVHQSRPSCLGEILHSCCHQSSGTSYESLSKQEFQQHTLDHATVSAVPLCCMFSPTRPKLPLSHPSSQRTQTSTSSHQRAV